MDLDLFSCVGSPIIVIHNLISIILFMEVQTLHISQGSGFWYVVIGCHGIDYQLS